MSEHLQNLQKALDMIYSRTDWDTGGYWQESLDAIKAKLAEAA